MNNEQQILTILYEMAMAIGGEVSVKPLLTRTLQQLLYNTAFPAGIAFLDLPQQTEGAMIEARLEIAIGDFELGERSGETFSLPVALMRGPAELRTDSSLLAALSVKSVTYTSFLRLPVGETGVILLLSPEPPHSELPVTRIFQPVMANLAKAIVLCRHHEAYTAGLVTERNVAWENLRKVNRTLMTLSSGNEVLVRATDEAALLEDMCSVVVEVGGYRTAWVGYAQHDEQKSVRPMAQHGFGAEKLGKLRFSWGDDEFGIGPTGAAIRSGEIQVITDTCADPRFAAWRAAAVESKCAAVLALPLIGTGSEPFGALTIETSEQNAFHEEEIRLLRELSGDLAYGITNLRNRAARQRDAELLYKGLEDTIQALSATVEMRDPYTSGHQRGVAQLAAAIASELGLAADRIHGIRLAGMVHDVGKIGVPAEILSKPARLTDVEMRIVREHPSMGHGILRDVKFSWPVAEIAHQHHERVDGSGYPRGLKGEEICMEARIVAVADVVEAMTSHRPYRPALDRNDALHEIESNRGVLYDAQVVDACRKVFNEGFTFERPKAGGTESLLHGVI